MDNFYEMATIVLGCIVIAQYVAKKKIERLTQRMFYMLDKLSTALAPICHVKDFVPILVCYRVAIRR